jgi:YD repeat-containing protein
MVWSNITAYTVDANGNMLTHVVTRATGGNAGLQNNVSSARRNLSIQGVARASAPSAQTLETRYEWDAAGRLVKTIYADGSATENVFNAIGKKVATIDQLGRQTNYEFDASGNLLRTIFPDGRAESSTFDDENHLLSSTDRLGRVTLYGYDARGSLTDRVYADGSQVRQIIDRPRLSVD